MSTDNNITVLPTVSELEATIVSLNTEVLGLRREWDNAVKRNSELWGEARLFTRRVSDAIVEAVDGEHLFDRDAGAWLFEQISIDLPESTVTRSVRVKASGTFEPEIEVDEDDISDQIEQGLVDVMPDADEWDVDAQYVNVPSFTVTVDVESASRDLEVDIELPWGADDSDETELIREAIEEEIGSEWNLISFEIN